MRTVVVELHRGHWK